MSEKKNAFSAIMAVFPNTKSITSFIEDSENMSKLESFISFAAQNNLIKSPDEKKFRAFIEQNTLHEDYCIPPNDLTTEELIENKEKILEVGLSIRGLTDRINGFLLKMKIDLPRLRAHSKITLHFSVQIWPEAGMLKM